MSFFKEDTRIGLKKLQIVYFVQRCANTSLLDEKKVIFSTANGENVRRIWFNNLKVLSNGAGGGPKLVSIDLF